MNALRHNPPSVMHRLLALCAGLRAAVRALRAH